MTNSLSSSVQRDLNESARPSMRPIPGATEAQRREGRNLALIHRHYLMELAKVARVLDRIAAGETPPDDLKDIVLATDMNRNLQAAGTICGHQCQVLMMHHNIEEAHMFPGLDAAGNEALRAVVQKLKSEHEVVHALIEKLADEADVLTNTPSQAAFDAARTTFDRLRSTVISHFGYEETELAEAIGVYLDGI